MNTLKNKENLPKFERGLAHLLSLCWSGGDFNEKNAQAYINQINYLTGKGYRLRDEHQLYVKRYREMLKFE